MWCGWQSNLDPVINQVPVVANHSRVVVDMYLRVQGHECKQRIALKRSLDAPSSSTFVVDISKLSHPDDIKDMYGKWLHSGSHTDVFICTYNEDDGINIEKAASGKNVYYLR